MIAYMFFLFDELTVGLLAPPCALHFTRLPRVCVSTDSERGCVVFSVRFHGFKRGNLANTSCVHAGCFTV